MSAIEFNNVSKTYGRSGRERPALQEVSFSLEQGELCLLMGPSGAGKSTLLRLILALERPEQGAIQVAGRDVHRLTRSSIPYLRRNLGVVFQDFRLLERAPPLENVRLALEVLGGGRREIHRRSCEALERVGIDPKLRRPVGTLSGGEQQRVALARAIAAEPPILLADEPTGNLDPELSVTVLNQLHAIKERGTTVLMATHDPVVRDMAEADRLLYLDQGKLIEDVALRRLRRITEEEMVAGAPPSERGGGPAVGAVA